ncbi:hypothetical protein CALCODRAFT_480578 [Calocera cornea HHB12733]|uniref:Phytochrome n=1 Tax=Calocera cornea HHB12733 TaxID=1353952 RepID=A0A165IKL1_9BASI|nr:hypothetical protein CALCODRAFT_480578 [Calocera cornea HHB12733]
MASPPGPPHPPAHPMPNRATRPTYSPLQSPTPSSAHSTAGSSYFGPLAPSATGGTSYVYPVRSLLSNIQPAPEVDTREGGYRSGSSFGGSGQASDAEGETRAQLQARSQAAALTQSQSQQASPVRAGALGNERQGTFMYPRQTPSDLGNPTDSSSSSSYFGMLPSRSRMRSASLPSPPTSDPGQLAPEEDDITPSQERPVAATDFEPSAQESVPEQVKPDDALSTLFVSDAPASEAPSRVSSADRPVSGQSVGNASSLGSGADADDVDALSHRTPLSLAETGIVRLPPSEPSTAGSRAGSRSNASRSQQGSRQRDTGGRESRESESNALMSRSSASASEMSVESGQPLMTMRFEHKATEGGHHVIVGREGNLTKCEDEPIRVPGAVQGFGVLVAVAEDEETGNLVVRQVSENATELLGLSPEYLFSLTCFTQTLPPSQADILWDNVQYLYELDSDIDATSSGQDSPQVFLLSGWGQPGSAFPEVADLQANPDPHQRREWTCWCAAHRPPISKAPSASGRTSSDTSTTLGQSLLILEFELERDVFNPLYPPFQPADVHMSGDSSPSAPGSSARSGAGSASTTVSRSSAGSGRSRGSGGGSSGGESGGSAASAQSSQTEMGDAHRESIVDPTHSPAGEEAGAVPAPSTGLTTGAEDMPEQYRPSPEDVLESTTNRAKPLKALERMRRVNRQVIARTSGGAAPFSTVGAGALESGSMAESVVSRSRRSMGPATTVHQAHSAGVSTMDVFALLSQVDDQWGRAADLESFLKIVVGIIKDLTQFHRVLIYQFDENWNGQVVAELVDWNQTHDLYKGLHFPAADIPAQARKLYAINKVRLLYDRSQVTARLVVRSRADLEPPLDMTHCYLRAMSPIHIKYLANMGVRGSMSVSIMAFGQLWGLIACHSYGQHGMRVSFPVRQMLRLMSDSISRNIERLSYAQRLHTRKLISTLPTDQHPTGYIVSNAEDLLSLFDADFGILVIGEGAKILGPNHSGQEVLIVAEYLRLKQFNIMQVSQAVTNDFPDLSLPSGMDVVAGLLYIPLSSGGRDFIAFLRKGQLKEVHWAGKPFKEEGDGNLEPRKSFKTWSETIAGRCRAWTDEQLETAGVLALVYGKFIEVWRQKETAVKTTQLTNLLLSNASHEVRTPLNHIINYLELALNGPLDGETRENLKLTHTASKSLLFTINDLLDLTRLESGNETSFNDPFDLPLTIQEAVHLYRIEAERRKLHFTIDTNDSPKIVLGDARKIRTVVANLTANAVKYTTSGTITVECRVFQEPDGLRDRRQIAVEIVVGDTGCGIEASKLESIFREFEQVESSTSRPGEREGLGLGLAVVARIVEQLGGQLRVDSKVGQGSRFSFLIPFALPSTGSSVGGSVASELDSRSVSPSGSGPSSKGSKGSAIDSLVEALQSDPLNPSTRVGSNRSKRSMSNEQLPSLSPSALRTPATERSGQPGYFDIEGSRYPVRSVKMDEFDLDKSIREPKTVELPASPVLGASGQRRAVDESHSRTVEQPRSPVVAQQAPAVARSAAATSAAAMRTRKKESPTAGAVKLRILIVEDDPINRMILHKRLVTDGHTVINTTNGQEAVEKIESDREFDCILMDIQMPILNGFEASEKIREFESTHPLAEGMARPSSVLNGRIPIFAVSASLVEGARETLSHHGMDGWVLKPVDYKRLGVLLRGISDHKQRSADVYKPGHWEVGGWLELPRGPTPPLMSPTEKKRSSPKH